MGKQHKFCGKWITCEDMAALPAINVFHRQLDGKTVPDSKFQNKHMLFRKKFIAETTKGTPLFLSADD